MLFAGTPGHGKTELSKKLAERFKGNYIKIDCKNHSNAWGMFGSDAGYVGSESPSPLSQFMEQNHKKRNIVLLDEFDHCDHDTFEAFYQLFEEGEYTLKLVRRNAGLANTSVLKCSNTVFILTTNRFDADVKQFNELYQEMIATSIQNQTNFEDIEKKINLFLRPKMRSFFQGGLSRRIDVVVPFFFFSEEESFVVAAKDLDQMCEDYRKPCETIGNIDVHASDYSIGEMSKEYFSYREDGASAIHRSIVNHIQRPIEQRWLRDEDISKQHFHYDRDTDTYTCCDLTDAQVDMLPYFYIAPTRASPPLNTDVGTEQSVPAADQEGVDLALINSKDVKSMSDDGYEDPYDDI